MSRRNNRNENHNKRFFLYFYSVFRLFCILCRMTKDLESSIYSYSLKYWLVNDIRPRKLLIFSLAFRIAITYQWKILFPIIFTALVPYLNLIRIVSLSSSNNPYESLDSIHSQWYTNIPKVSKSQPLPHSATFVTSVTDNSQCVSSRMALRETHTVAVIRKSETS